MALYFNKIETFNGVLEGVQAQDAKHFINGRISNDIELIDDTESRAVLSVQIQLDSEVVATLKQQNAFTLDLAHISSRIETPQEIGVHALPIIRLSYFSSAIQGGKNISFVVLPTLLQRGQKNLFTIGENDLGFVVNSYLSPIQRITVYKGFPNPCTFLVKSEDGQAPLNLRVNGSNNYFSVISSTDYVLVNIDLSNIFFANTVNQGSLNLSPGYNSVLPLTFISSDKCGVMLKWQNNEGGISTHVFAPFYKYTEEDKQKGVLDEDTNPSSLGKEVERVTDLVATVDSEDYKKLLSLPYSPKVYRWSEVGEEWFEVIALTGQEVSTKNQKGKVYVSITEKMRT